MQTSHGKNINVFGRTKETALEFRLVHGLDDGAEHGGGHEAGVVLPLPLPRAVPVVGDAADEGVVVLPVHVDGLDDGVELEVEADDAVAPRELLAEAVVERHLAAGADRAQVDLGLAVVPISGER